MKVIPAGHYSEPGLPARRIIDERPEVLRLVLKRWYRSLIPVSAILVVLLTLLQAGEGLCALMLPWECEILTQSLICGFADTDIGGATECWRYALRLSSTTRAAQVGTSADVVAFVADTAATRPAAGCRLSICVDVGEVLSVTRRGIRVKPPRGTRSTYGIVGTDGKVEASVTRQDGGDLRVTATIDQCVTPMTRELRIRFLSDDAGDWTDGDWPVFHGDVRSTGVTPSPLGMNSSALTKIWAVRLEGTGGPESHYSPYHWSSPVSDSHLVFVGTDKGWLYGFDALSNQPEPAPIYGEQLGVSSIHGTPSVCNGVVYVATEEDAGTGRGRLYALAPNWQTKKLDIYLTWDCPSGTLSGPPAVFGSTVFAASSDAKMYAVDMCDPQRSDGADGIAVGDAPGPNTLQPDVRNGPCYPIWIGDRSGSVTEVCPYNRASTKTWFGDGAPLTSACVFYEGYVFIGSTGNCVYRLKDNGSSIAGERLDMPSPVWGTPALFDGRLYVGCDNGDFCSANAVGPEFANAEVSKVNLGFAVYSSPAISSSTGLVFVATVGGDVYALDADDVTNRVWGYHISDDLGPETTVYSSPAIIAGRLFIVAGDPTNRYLYCFGDREFTPRPSPSD